MPVMTNWVASVYNGEIFSNSTDRFSIRQVTKYRCICLDTYNMHL